VVNYDFYVRAFLCFFFIFTFVVDFYFFNSGGVKKIKSLILQGKRQHGDCFTTLLVTVVSSFAIVHHIQTMEILAAMETFIVCLLLRFLFENSGNIKRLVLLSLFSLSILIGISYNSTFLLETCLLLLGCSLWKSKKNGDYTFPELLLIFYILFIITWIYSNKDLPISLFDFLKSSNSYCVGENEQGDSNGRKAFSQATVTKAATLSALGIAFFTASNMMQKASFTFREFKHLNLPKFFTFPKLLSAKVYASQTIFFVGIVSVYSGAGVFVSDTLECGLETVVESTRTLRERLPQLRDPNLDLPQTSPQETDTKIPKFEGNLNEKDKIFDSESKQKLSSNQKNALDIIAEHQHSAPTEALKEKGSFWSNWHQYRK
jgi:hypothetical protein